LIRALLQKHNGIDCLIDVSSSHMAKLAWNDMIRPARFLGLGFIDFFGHFPGRVEEGEVIRVAFR
jgi:hypothetical protein